MTDDELSYSDVPNGMTEKDVLARLTVEEKREIAYVAIIDFPHLHNGMLLEWIEGHGGDLSGLESASIPDMLDHLLDLAEEQVRSGDDPEAIDRYIYGYLYEANLKYELGIEPEEMINRDRRERWEGVYDD